MVGLQPNTSQYGSEIESVNATTGALHIEIPLSSITQRGRTITTKYIYNSPAFHADFVPNSVSNGRDQGYWQVHTSAANDWNWVTSAGGWGLTFDSPDPNATPIPCTASPSDPYGTVDGTLQEYTNFAVIDPQGNSHPLDLDYSSTIGSYSGSSNFWYTVNPLCAQGVYATSGWTLDGSGVFVDLGAGTIHTKDGTLVAQGTPWTVQSGPFTSSTVAGATWNGPFVDSNGNQLSSAPFGPTTGSIYSGTQTFTIYDAEGNAQSLIFSYESVSILTNDCPALQHYLTAGNSCIDITPAIALPYVHKITLPNGTYYQFDYAQNSHGELTSLRLPTGATINYVYGPMLIDDHNPRKAPIYEHVVVSQKTIINNGISSVWIYTPSGPGEAPQITIEDPSGNCEFHGSSFIGGLRPVPQETDVEDFAGCDTTGVPLKAVHTDYAFENIGNSVGQVINMRPIRVTTTIGGVSSKVETDYETFTTPREGYSITFTRMNPIEIREYDFGAVSPTRVTDYTYLHECGSSVATAQNYLDLNIVDRVLKKTILTASPSSPRQPDCGSGIPAGAIFSQIFEYDNYSTPLLDEPNAAQHAGAFGTNYLSRGNVTASSVWNNQDGSWIKTNYQYDILGNQVAIVDPRYATTHISYTDRFNDSACVPTGMALYAYPTIVTNALSQSTQTTYSSCTGLATSIKGPNTDTNDTTTYTYDSMNRVTTVTYPPTEGLWGMQQGQTINCYTDTGGSTCPQTSAPYSIYTSTLASPSPTVIRIQTFDGLGRPTSSILESDPAGPVNVDTTYDLLGRIASVSNPYRTSSDPTSSDPTAGITSYAYDPLGRMTLQCQPDNGSNAPCQKGSSYLEWSYNGNVVTFYDELRNSWQRTYDARNRLTQVVEPGSLTTTYQYNALDNLTCADQWGA